MEQKDRGTTSPPRPRRQRTTPETQAARILASAERLFLTHGFTGTSMEMLVAETGGSKRDIYRLFGDKRGLFRRVVAGFAGDGVLAMRAAPGSAPLEAALAGIGRPFLEFLLSERTLNLHRLMVADAKRLGDAGLDFIRYGPTAVYTVVEEYLRDQFDEEALPAREAAEAARVFIDGLSAELQLRALLGDVAGPAERERRIDTAVRLFAAGLRQRVGPPRHGRHGPSDGGRR